MEAVNWKREEKLEQVRKKKLEWQGVASCRSLLIEVVNRAIPSSHEDMEVPGEEETGVELEMV